MANILNYLKVQKIDVAKVRSEHSLMFYYYILTITGWLKVSVEQVKEMLGDIMTECFGRVKVQQKSEGCIKVEQGFATILLPGNDVPFHSQYLWSGVKAYFLAIS